MELALAVLLVLVLVVAVSTRASGRFRYSKKIKGIRARRWQGTRDTLGKVDRLVDMFRNIISASPRSAGEEKYAHYYVAYLDEVAKAVSREEEVDYSALVQEPVLIEASRLCGKRDGDIHEGERLLAGIVSSEFGRRGAEDGRLDGAHAIDETRTGPYFTRLKTFFEA